MLKDSIDNDPYQFKPEITVKDTYGVTNICRPQRVEELVRQDKLCYDSDIKAVNILLLGCELTSTLSSSTIKLQKKYRIVSKNLWKDKMLLAQAQEAGFVLNDEQHDFLYYDDEATANAIFIAKLSHVGSINNDTVEPRYDSDILYEVPHYDTYHAFDMLNSNIQELGYIEKIVSNNESYDELTSNNNVISYTNYMLPIENDDNYVPPSVQKNDMMLSIIEQMKSQVEKCNMINQESQSVNESLTSELERYKDRVRILEYAAKDGCFEKEAYLERELNIAICDRNRKETLILAEESRLKMLEKQAVVNTKPIDYSKLNKLYKYFVPQQQLSAEQLYWSLTPSPLESFSKPTKVFPKKLPSTGQVLKNLNSTRDLLRKFDECIKRRTTLSPHQIGSWEQLDIKGAFKKDVIAFSEHLKESFKLFQKGFIAEVKEMKDIFEQIKDKVDQCSLAKRCFEI
nr:hypothetical protein [Tanacetum cinerariifolium]